MNRKISDKCENFDHWLHIFIIALTIFILLLIFLLPGITINIPKNGLRRLKEKYIMKNYDGSKSKLNKLALECDLSPRYVYKLIKKNMKNSSIQSMICDSWYTLPHLRKLSEVFIFNTCSNSVHNIFIPITYFYQCFGINMNIQGWW